MKCDKKKLTFEPASLIQNIDPSYIAMDWVRRQSQLGSKTFEQDAWLRLGCNLLEGSLLRVPTLRRMFSGPEHHVGARVRTFSAHGSYATLSSELCQKSSLLAAC
jgi:hypothetical protein